MTLGVRCRLVVLALVVIVLPWPVSGQDAQQQSEAQVYEHFRRWVSRRATTGPQTEATAQQTELLNEYRKVLAAEGALAPEIDRRVRIITEHARRLEVDRWNRVLTAPEPTFNVKPNAFLVRSTKGIRPGTALDVGMGQGRNAIYLAQQGWAVTGFDPAEQAVAAARDQARRLGVTLTALAVGDDQFDFGNERWDLVVLSYVGFRTTVARIYESVKPGGLVVVEAFHRDSLKNGPIGPDVVFETNELLKLFARFRVVHYEDVEDTSDFGMQKNRVVRLVAQKL